MDSELSVPRLFLIGFMGVGKTTVGRRLAMRLGVPFFDLDELVEKQAGQTVEQIFSSAGEKRFRALETEVLKLIVGQGPGVIATGGGTFTRPENREIIRATGMSIWLDAPPDVTIWRGSHGEHRPLWGSEDKARELLAQRLPHYRHADIRFDMTDSTPDEVAERLAEMLKTHKRS